MVSNNGHGKLGFILLEKMSKGIFMKPDELKDLREKCEYGISLNECELSMAVPKLLDYVEEMQKHQADSWHFQKHLKGANKGAERNMKMSYRFLDELTLEKKARLRLEEGCNDALDALPEGVTRKYVCDALRESNEILLGGKKG